MVASARPNLAKAAIGESLETVVHAACIGAIYAAGEACMLCACWQHIVQKLTRDSNAESY
jgi:hypothetical protein